MTMDEIRQEMEKIGFDKDVVTNERYPITYWQLVGLASHFYSLGFSQSVSEFLDADEDYVSSMTQ